MTSPPISFRNKETHVERCRAKFISGTIKCMTKHAAHLSTLQSRHRQRLSHDKPRPCSCQRHEDRLEIGRGYITCCRDIEEEEAIAGSCGSHEDLHMRAHENGSVWEQYRARAAADIEALIRMLETQQQRTSLKGHDRYCMHPREDSRNP